METHNQEHLPDTGVEYSVVVPVYNSTESLVELVSGVKTFFTDTHPATFEIIFVDDASPNPRTWPTLEQLHEQDSRVKIIQLRRNFGQQPATLCGFQHARGDFVLTMDDDLQHQPAEIAKLIAARDHDVVMAQFARRRHGPIKTLFSKIKQWFDYHVLSRPRNLHMSSFRLLRRPVVESILTIDTTYPFIGSLIFMVTSDVKGVTVAHRERSHGRSGYTFTRMLRLFFNLMINNSTLLLNIVGIFGLVIAVFSLGVAVVVVLKKFLYDTPVMGWTSLMGITSFVGGVNLLSVSIVGQYLIRIIHEVQGKPTYTTRHVKL